MMTAARFLVTASMISCLILSCGGNGGEGDGAEDVAADELDTAEAETQEDPGHDPAPDPAPDRDADSIEDPAAEDASDGNDAPDQPFDVVEDEMEDAAEEDATPYEGILCGFDVCLGEEVCCVYGEPPVPECLAEADCTGFFIAWCDGPEDCDPGLKCCGGEMAESAYCYASCAPHVPLCHDESDCGAGEFCCTAMTPSGWSFEACSPTPCG